MEIIYEGPKPVHTLNDAIKEWNECYRELQEAKRRVIELEGVVKFLEAKKGNY